MSRSEDHSSHRPGLLGTWPRVLGLALVVFIAFVTIAYLTWSNRTSRKLADAREQLRAAGEPVTARDLMGPPIPDERNAALLLREAGAMIDDKSEALRALYEMEWPEPGTRLPLTDQHRATLRRAVDENQAVFPLIERASRLEGVDWEIDYTAGLALDLRDELQHPRTLARLVEAAALLAHDRGDHAEALARAEQLGFLGRAVGTQAILISSLTAVGISSMQVNLLGDLAPTLKLAGEGDSQGIPPEQVQRLIAAMLDDAGPRQVIVRGLKGERAIQQDILEALLEGNTQALEPPASPAGPNAPNQFGALLTLRIMKPALRDNALVVLQHMNLLIENADAPDLPTFQQQVPDVPPVAANSRYRYMLVNVMLPSMTRVMRTHYRHLNDRHLAAAALAVRWYAAEHDGKLPETLRDLVPRYLPHVPRDLLVGGDTTIGYIPDGDRPRLYHAGENARHDDGREPDPNATTGRNRDTTDRVMHLKPQPAGTDARERDE